MTTKILPYGDVELTSRKGNVRLIPKEIWIICGEDDFRAWGYYESQDSQIKAEVQSALADPKPAVDRLSAELAQQTQDKARARAHADAMLDLKKAETKNLTTGQIRQRLTVNQFHAVIAAARKFHHYANCGGDSFEGFLLASELGGRITRARNAKAQITAAAGRRRPRKRAWDFPGAGSHAAAIYFQKPLKERLAKHKAAQKFKRDQTKAKRQLGATRRQREVAAHIGGLASRLGVNLFNGSRYAQLQVSPIQQFGSKSYKNWRDNNYAHPTVWISEGKLSLMPCRGAAIEFPSPSIKLMRAAKLDEPHPIGVLPVPVSSQPDVMECWQPLKSAQRLGVRRAAPLWEWSIVGYSHKGYQVPKCFADGTISLTDITAETNSEVKRLMIDKFGTGRYLKESGATHIHQDDWGTLYDLSYNIGNQSIVGHRVVHLLNSTEEDDGTRREYWIEVPNTCQTAHEAVAWSYGETAATYRPEFQS